MIVLELTKEYLVWIDKAEFINRKLPLAGDKTGLELVQADILAGTDETGHAKYRKILNHHGILTNWETDTWRGKLDCEEKPVISPGSLES